jgi:hypothetical protein
MLKSHRIDTYYTNRAGGVYNCPPPLGSPCFARGTAKRRAHSVPPACRGNLMEGVINCCFCELWLGDWYYIYITSGVTRGRAVPRWYTRPEVSIIELTPAPLHR